jgi:hypothetical protein
MEQLEMIRVAVSKVLASDNLIDYLQRLVAYTRQSPNSRLVSRRAVHWRCWTVPKPGRRCTIAVMSCRKISSLVLAAVAAHRLVPSGDYAGDGDALVDLLRRNVDVIGSLSRTSGGDAHTCRYNAMIGSGDWSPSGCDARFHDWVRSAHTRSP